MTTTEMFVVIKGFIQLVIISLFCTINHTDMISNKKLESSCFETSSQLLPFSYDHSRKVL